MDEMTAFERQVAREVVLEAGPDPSIDAMAISRSVTTQPPAWRLRSMFSATRFVIAGVIVVLFGGFLLAGVLTTQSDEALPVGLSPSPEARSLQPVRLPAELPDGVRSGTLDTPLGPARWAHVQDGPGSVEQWVVPLPAPGGFIALDTPHGQSGRLWRSPDLVAWASEPIEIEGYIDGYHADLSLAGGTYWLKAPSGFWRSEDTATWQRIDLSELVSPFPEWLDGGRDLGAPVSSAGVTLVPVSFGADIRGSDLGLTGLSGDWWLESEEPGVYVATGRWGNTRGVRVHTRLRFEETDSGLRVVNADDDTELAELDGVGMDFIDAWAAHGYPPAASRLTLVEGDRLVPVDGPDMSGHDIELYGKAAGFIVHGSSPDSDLIDVWLSRDGVAWAESEPLGDDPGEPAGDPAGDLDMRHNTYDRPLFFTWDGGQWTTTNGITWLESEYPERLLSPELEQVSVHVASSWLLLSKDGLSFKADDGDEWVTVDISELGIGPAVARWLTENVAQEFGIDSYEGISRISAISPETIMLTVGVPDAGVGTPETWIITFDDMPGETRD